MENSKLIAEFMGVVFHDDENQYYNADGLHIGNTLQYYTSWDWLMPVVERIEQVMQGVPQQMLHLSLYSTKDEVYDAVVKSIRENTEYKTCDRCCYDIVDDDGDIMEHICIDDNFYSKPSEL